MRSSVPARRAGWRVLLLVALLFPPLAAGAAVDEPGTVDALQVRAEKPFAYLLMVQDRPWTDETLRMVAAKLDAYAGYALGGGLVRDEPLALGKPVRIVLVAETPPTAQALAALRQWRSRIALDGIEFAWGGADDLLALVDEE